MGKGRTDGKGGESSRSRESGRVSGGERGSQQGGVQQQGGQHHGGRVSNPQSQQGGGGYGQGGSNPQSHQGARGSNPQSQQQGGQHQGARGSNPQSQQQGGQHQGARGSNPQSQQGGGGYGQGGSNPQSHQGGRSSNPQSQQQGGQYQGARGSNPQFQQQGGQHQGSRGSNPQSQQQGGQYQGARGSNPQFQQQGGQYQGARGSNPQFQQQGGQHQIGRRSNPQSQQGGGGYGQPPPQRYQQQYGGPQEHHVRERGSGGPVYQGGQGGSYGGGREGGSATGPPQRQSVPNQHQATTPTYLAAISAGPLQRQSVPNLHQETSRTYQAVSSTVPPQRQSVPDLHQATSRTHQAVSSTGQPQRQSVPDLHQATSNQAVSSQPTLSEANTTQMPQDTVLAKQFEQGAPSQDCEIPTRPGQGKMGTPCKVKANHFFFELPKKVLHQYNVTITPEVKSRGFNRALMKQLVDLYRESHLGRRLPAYDGRKSLYTAGSLPFSSKEFTITPPDKGEGAKGEGAGGKRREKKEFTVVIEEAGGHPDLHHLESFLNRNLVDYPKEAVQALDIVLRQEPTSRYTPVAGSFYSPEIGKKRDNSPDIQSLDEFLESWRGFYQSIRPTQNGLSLNMDMSSTAFIKASPVIEFVQYLLKRNISSRSLTDAECRKIIKALRGVKVEGSKGLKYRISDLTATVTEKLRFVDETNTQKSVVEYFSETYGVRIQHTQLPCLQVGNSDKTKYLPMEVCKIVEGQRYSKRLNETQITALLKVACKPPREREDDILRTINLNNYEEDPFANEFGIKISTSMASFEARVLHPPSLKYRDESGSEVNLKPKHGKWNTKNMKMVNGGNVNSWICINFSGVKNYIARNFCQKLAEKCINSGIEFNKDPVLPLVSFLPEQVEEALNTQYQELSKKSKNIDLLIAILPYKDGSLYGKLKRICETKLGIVSQCCLAENVKNVSMQYMASVALKINVKVGGRNTVLYPDLSTKLRGAPTIIFGADVTHPHPGDDSSPSIAAVVASQDWPQVTKYTGLVCAQEPRKEVIQDLYTVKGLVHGGMIRELLIAFYNSTQQKPGRIIFYRDGVGEGQFNEVLRYELDAIRKACASLDERYQPPVTFVVVQKRHHTRLFADNDNDKESVDKIGNILPGTVVDSDICHPREFDFYLCSHAGIQGTSRPAHYHVLFDKSNVNADALQSLTNDLCYTYARCTRSVSIVPPAYYAHILAARARLYIEPDASDSGSMASGSIPRVIKKLPELHPNLKHPNRAMFFC